MAVTGGNIRVRPSTDFVEEWYKVIERSISRKCLEHQTKAKQIIALDRILSEFNNRKRLFKDIPAWEEYQEVADVKYQVRSLPMKMIEQHTKKLLLPCCLSHQNLDGVHLVH